MPQGPGPRVQVQVSSMGREAAECLLAWRGFSEREANAIALDGAKNWGTGSREGQGTPVPDWFPILGSHCCTSDAGDGLGELFNHSVSLGRGRGNRFSSP